MPADPIRPSSRRGASGAWNRLKPVREDTLEAYGLPSKGETRLNDFKTQETYYNRILEKYMRFCAQPSTTDALSASFASLRIDTAATSLRPNTTTPAAALPLQTITPNELPRFPTPSPNLLDAFTHSTTPSTRTRGEDSKDKDKDKDKSSDNPLPSILLALRKLREALTATSRTDGFATLVYTFSIRTSILCQDWASYFPSLLYLLRRLHPVTPLSPPVLSEMTSYLLLDLCCRQSDYTAAYSLLHFARLNYAYADRRVEAVLRALVRDDWVTFWRMRKCVDGYQRRIMADAEAGLRTHVLKALGKSYLSVDRGFLERVAERGWDELVSDGVGWELESMGDGRERVVIRRPKGR